MKIKANFFLTELLEAYKMQMRTVQLKGAYIAFCVDQESLKHRSIQNI